MAKLLIKNIELLHTPNGEMQNIAVEDNKIVYVGKDVPADFAADEIVDGKGKLATAGMVNTHGHVSMTLLRSYADDMALMDWLQNKIWPIEDKMDANDIYWGAMLGIVEMLKGGTTCFADMYAFMEDVARACAETGIRANLSRGLIGVAPDKDVKLAENTVLATMAVSASPMVRTLRILVLLIIWKRLLPRLLPTRQKSRCICAKLNLRLIPLLKSMA